MHFSPPSKDSINTDFTNLNAISESGRNSVSRQSLLGEFAVGESFVFLFSRFGLSSALSSPEVLSAPNGHFRHYRFELVEAFISLPSRAMILLFFFPPLAFFPPVGWRRSWKCERMVFSANVKFIGIKFNDT